MKPVKLTKKDITRGVVIMNCRICGQLVKSLEGRPFLHNKTAGGLHHFACEGFQHPNWEKANV